MNTWTGERGTEGGICADTGRIRKEEPEGRKKYRNRGIKKGRQQKGNDKRRKREEREGGNKESEKRR
jgi:hypothetical protein